MHGINYLTSFDGYEATISNLRFISFLYTLLPASAFFYYLSSPFGEFIKVIIVQCVVV